MIHLQYTLTEKEFLDYNFYAGWQVPEQKNLRLRYYVVPPVFAFIALAIFLFDSEKRGYSESSIIIGISGLVFLVFFIVYRIRERFDKQALKLIKSSQSDAVLAETQLTISETGLSGKTKNSEVKYSWDAFQKKIIANDCYYLFISSRHAVVIPFRAFKNEDVKNAFEKMLSQYLPLQADLPMVNE